MASSSWRMSSVFRFSLAQITKLSSLFLFMLAVLTGATAADSGQSVHLIVSGSLPVGNVGVAYNGAASASGGVAPYHYAVTHGTLPGGVALDAATGIISGVPQAAGLFSFGISAWDKNGIHGDKRLAININGESISVTISPTTAVVVSGGSQQFTASVSGTSNTAVTWSTTAGTISSAGMFSAPATTANTSVVVTATSVAQSSTSASANVTLTTKSSGPTITTTSIPSVIIGSPYTADLSATGGAVPYAWSIASGSLPGGINLNRSTGLINGTISSTGNFTFVAKVTDANGKTNSRSLTLSVSSSTGSFDGPAELPRVFMQTSLANTPAPGNTIPVPSGGNLQTALNSANCGDTVALQAGATFTGKFTLPAKSCDDLHWIIIRTSAPDTSLPPEGSRISPCYAGVGSLPGRPSFHCSALRKVLARVINPHMGAGPFLLAPGASHYRLLGLELTRTPGTGLVGPLVFSKKAPADHLILDRCWLHGTPQDDTSAGISFTGMTNAAVIDSFLTDFHCTAIVGACTDAKAIGGGVGSLPGGPYKVVDNFLEASGENILFGGGPATTTPADIEIRRNHFFKPSIWQSGQPGFVGGQGGHPFIVKNLFELKNAQRVLLEANILEYSWGGFGQHGFAFMLTPKNQAGTHNTNVCPLCQVTDVTIRYSTVSHVAAGVTIATALSDSGGMAAAGARFSLHDITIDDVNARAYIGSGALFSFLNSWWQNVLNSVTINHITGFGDPTFLRVISVLDTRPHPSMWGFVISNNILGLGEYTFASAGGGPPNCAFTPIPLTTLNLCFSKYAFSYNAIIGSLFASKSSDWPSGNYFAASPGAVQFVNYNNAHGGNYQLLSSSPYKNAASDGKDIGADISALQAAISGVY